MTSEIHHFQAKIFFEFFLRKNLAFSWNQKSRFMMKDDDKLKKNEDFLVI